MDFERKPLAERTLGEVQTYCRTRVCGPTCDFKKDGTCPFEVLPFSWDLHTVPRLQTITTQELHILAFTKADWVTRNIQSSGFVSLWRGERPSFDGSTYSAESGERVLWLGDMLADCFPSMKPGDYFHFSRE